MNNILKDCKKCGIKFQTNEYDLVPIEGHFDSGYDENDLSFICKCPYCGEINTLSEEEQMTLSLETMKLLMEKYSHCSSKIKRIWEIESEEAQLIERLATLETEKANLNKQITFAMQKTSKDCLYNHWPLTSEIIKNEEQKRKKLEIKRNK